MPETVPSGRVVPSARNLQSAHGGTGSTIGHLLGHGLTWKSHFIGHAVPETVSSGRVVPSASTPQSAHGGNGSSIGHRLGHGLSGVAGRYLLDLRRPPVNITGGATPSKQYQREGGSEREVEREWGSYLAYPPNQQMTESEKRESE